MNYYKKIVCGSPGVIVFASLCLVIALGSALLSLSIAQREPILPIDVIFTATSAVCVTGLFTISLGQFTTFGHFIIMILMQIGGIGLITMSLMFISLFVKKFGLSTHLMVGYLLDLESWQNSKHLLFFIALITILSELIGGLCIAFVLLSYEAYPAAMFHGIFHSIASFCNVGIELPGELYATQYKTDYLVLGITMLLSFIGGLGFITWYEIWAWIKALHRGTRFTFSLHSKIILYSTSILLPTSALLIWLLERNHAFFDVNFPLSIVYAFFESVTSKSTGFALIDLNKFHFSSILVMMVLAFVGSSPASTGSGVKITAFALLIATVRSALTGKAMVEIWGRRIANDQIFKSVAICFLGIFCIVFLTFILLILEPHQPFAAIFFESWSALTNLGSSFGIKQMAPLSKIVVMLSMMIGRIGSFTLILSLKMVRGAKDSADFIYPEERVML